MAGNAVKSITACRDCRPASPFPRRFVTMALQRPHQVWLPETLRLTGALRATLLRHCAQGQPMRLPSWLCGHDPDGGPTSDAHLAFFPLAQAGARQGNGRIHGLGIALPDATPTDEIEHWLGAFLNHNGKPGIHRLYDRHGLDCHVIHQRQDGSDWTPASNWAGASTRWASATPIVLDRYPKGADAWLAAEPIIAQACQRAGLPEPELIIASPRSPLIGSPDARRFPPMPQGGGTGTRWHCHATLVFSEPVRGPVLLGAGRFRGYGMCHPLPDGND